MGGERSGETRAPASQRDRATQRARQRQRERERDNERSWVTPRKEGETPELRTARRQTRGSRETPPISVDDDERHGRIPRKVRQQQLPAVLEVRDRGGAHSSEVRAEG